MVRDVEYDFDGTTINIKNEIAKVREYWAKKEPIPMDKSVIHSLDMFTSHINAIFKGGFECAQCHGDVAKYGSGLPCLQT